MKYLGKLSLILFILYPLIGISASKIKSDASVGFILDDTVVYNLDGQRAELSDLWREKPVLLITGSLSCPLSRNSLKTSHKLINKFSEKVNVALLYVIDAHPKGDISPYSGDEWIPRANFKDNILIPQPKSLSERTDRATQFKQLLKLQLPIMVDNMQNMNWDALGKYPNAAILIDRKGKVIYKQKKFQARLMAKKLKTYIKNGALN